VMAVIVSVLGSVVDVLVVVEPGTVVLVVVVGLDVVVVEPGTVVVVLVVVGVVVVVVDEVVDDVVDVVDVVEVVEVVEVVVVVVVVQPSGWVAVADVFPMKPSDHVASVANVTEETLVDRTGELNVCDWLGASDQFVLEPGGVIVIVPTIVGPGSLGVSTAEARHPPPSTHTALGTRLRKCANATPPGITMVAPPSTTAPMSTRRQTPMSFSSWLLKSATEPSPALHIARGRPQLVRFGSPSWSRTLSA
jgi:hypothetical protein